MSYVNGHNLLLPEKGMPSTGTELPTLPENVRKVKNLNYKNLIYENCSVQYELLIF